MEIDDGDGCCCFYDMVSAGVGVLIMSINKVVRLSLDFVDLHYACKVFDLMLVGWCVTNSTLQFCFLHQRRTKFPMAPYL